MIVHARSHNTICITEYSLINFYPPDIQLQFKYVEIDRNYLPVSFYHLAIMITTIIATSSSILLSLCASIED